jgi:hypothetical protein
MVLAPDNQESGVPLWAFISGATLIVIAAFAAVWFMFPAPDTRHDLVSPSGTKTIELAEICGETGCDRVAILDDEGVRAGCPLPEAGNVPLFTEVSATWSTDETAVRLEHVGADGRAGSMALTLTDCTITSE